MPLRDSRTVRGAERLGRRIRTIVENLALPVLTNDIGSLLVKRTKDRFEQEVDPDGVPWKPLNRKYAAQKAAEGHRTKILQRTGTLKDSIRKIQGTPTGTLYTNTGAGVRIGVDEDKVPYARYHQEGTRAIPRRVFLGVGRLDVKAVDSLLRRKSKSLQRELEAP